MDRALQMFQNHVFLVLQSVYYIACIVRTVVLYLQDNNLGELAAELLAKVPNNTGLRPNWTLLTGKELQTETSLAIKKKLVYIVRIGYYNVNLPYKSITKSEK